MATRKVPQKKSRTTRTPAAGKAPSSAKTDKSTRMAIDLDQLEELMQTIERHGITELELEKGGERIVLRRGSVTTVTHAAPVVATAPAPAGAHLHAPAHSAPAAKEEDPNVVFVTSPFVGTFYRAGSPTAEPFVKDGQQVAAGQTLCIVEAMKLMNEIEAEFACSIVECLVENGKPVEYGDKLFKVKKR
ncbi:MAG: acetyl-CoA carboxylase biotin carboxyl carrier protein [Polyangiales bacterium]